MNKTISDFVFKNYNITDIGAGEVAFKLYLVRYKLNGTDSSFACSLPIECDYIINNDNEGISRMKKSYNEIECEIIKNFANSELKEEKSKEIKQFENLISAIKTMGDYNKKIFTQLLLANGCIIRLEQEIEDIKIVYINFGTTGDRKRERRLYIYKGEHPNDYKAAKKKWWSMAKTQGKDFVINHLTEEGKAYYATEKGKANIDSWFD